MERYELPEGWEWTTVGVVSLSIQYGYTATSSQNYIGPRYLRITDIQEGGVNWSTVPRCEITSDVLPKYLLQAGDIVFARSGATTGKSYLITDCPEAVFASYLIRVQTHSEVLPSYLSHFFNSKDYWEQVTTRGNAQPNANAQVLGRIQFPLPPLPEQRRIVAKIESLFEESRTAREELDRIPALLKQYRQSVLSVAFRGELVERDPDAEPASLLLERIRAERRRKWEDELRAKGKHPELFAYEEPPAPDTSDLPELPQGWEWTQVDQLGHINDQAVLTGPFGSNLGKDDFVSSGVPVLTIGCLTEQGLSLNKAFYVTEDKAAGLQRYRVQQGDILFSRMASVGRADLVLPEFEGVIINYHLMRLRLSNIVIDPKFFIYYVRGTQTVVDYLSKVNHGATRDGINTEQLLSMPVTLAPLSEQRRIVARIQELFAQADVVEEAVEAARQQLDRLDQSVLARAFRGELVPQAPDDEPASMLLERIRAEREAQAGPKRVRKGRKDQSEETYINLALDL